MKRALIWAFLTTVPAVFGVNAETLQIEPSKDNTLYEDDAGAFSNGAGNFLFIGLTGDDNGIINLARRSVMAFDLTAIPPGSLINSVDLTLMIDRVPPGAASGDAMLHRLTQDWGEGASNPPGPEGRGTAAAPGDTTWLHTFFDTSFWNTPGGDFVATPSATSTFTNAAGPLTFSSSAQLMSDVQFWVNDPTTNFGWVLIGDEQSDMNARRLISRENPAAGSPMLTIDFTPAAPQPPAIGVPTLNLPALILLVLAILMVPFIRLRHSR